MAVLLSADMMEIEGCSEFFFIYRIYGLSVSILPCSAHVTSDHPAINSRQQASPIMSKDGLPRAAFSPRALFQSSLTSIAQHKHFADHHHSHSNSCLGAKAVTQFIHMKPPSGTWQSAAIAAATSSSPPLSPPPICYSLSSAHQHQISVATSSTSFLLSKSCTLICWANSIS